MDHQRRKAIPTREQLLAVGINIPEDENGKLLAKVMDTAQTFLRRASQDIDEALGEGYAAANPMLVVIHTLACAHAAEEFVEMMLKSGIKL